MPSKLRRYTSAGWVDVADFEVLSSGAKWLTGTGNPTAAAVDTFYVDMTNKSIYYRVDNTTSWALVGNLSNWDTAWGIVATGTMWNSGVAGALLPASPGAYIADVGTIVFTPVAGRMYRFELWIRAVDNAVAAGGEVKFSFRMKRNGTLFLGADPWFRSEGQYGNVRIPFLATATELTAGVSASFACQMTNQHSQQARLFMDGAWFTLEDVGPVR